MLTWVGNNVTREIEKMIADGLAKTYNVKTIKNFKIQELELAISLIYFHIQRQNLQVKEEQSAIFFELIDGLDRGTRALLSP